MKRVTCWTVAGAVAGALLVEACSSSSRSRNAEPVDGGDSGTEAGGRPGAGGGPAKDGGPDGSGGATLDASTPDARVNVGTGGGADASPPDASLTDATAPDATLADATTPVEAGFSCVDASAPSCAWLSLAGDAGGGLYDSTTNTFTVALRPGIRVASATLTVAVCECVSSGTPACNTSDALDMTVTGNTLSVNLDAATFSFFSAWIESFRLAVETTCGQSLLVTIDNLGRQNTQCTDDVSLASCSQSGT